jgi:hypothetical protein
LQHRGEEVWGWSIPVIGVGSGDERCASTTTIHHQQHRPWLSLAGGTRYESERATRCTAKARSEVPVGHATDGGEERGASGAGGERDDAGARSEQQRHMVGARGGTTAAASGMRRDVQMRIRDIKNEQRTMRVLEKKMGRE